MLKRSRSLWLALLASTLLGVGCDDGSGKKTTDDEEGAVEGEGEGTPTGEGEGEGEGIPSGEGEGEGIPTGEGEGEGTGEGEGEGLGEGEGEGAPDPCTPNPCTRPPAAACSPEGGLVTYAAEGTCQVVDGAADCTYAPTETLCDPVPQRCNEEGARVISTVSCVLVGAAAQCVATPDILPCDDPPPAHCTEDGKLELMGAGVCELQGEEAVCVYQPELRACDSPPPSTCNEDGTSLTFYEAAGSCRELAAGPDCVYTARSNVCDHPPGTRCSPEGHVLSYAPLGACEELEGSATCRYEETLTRCDPVAPSCADDGVTLITPGHNGCVIAEDGQVGCHAPTRTTDCSLEGKVCQDAACVLGCSALGHWNESWSYELVPRMAMAVRGGGFAVLTITEGEAGWSVRGIPTDNPEQLWSGEAEPTVEAGVDAVVTIADGVSRTYTCQYEGCDQLICHFTETWNDSVVQGTATWLRRPALVDWCALSRPEEPVVLAAGGQAHYFGLMRTAGITDRTPAFDHDPLVVAELGYGAPGSEPGGDWAWFAATFAEVEAIEIAAPEDLEIGPDEYMGLLERVLPGQYDVAFRFSLDGGETWRYCDRDAGPGSSGSEDGYQPANAGQLTALGCPDACADAERPAPRCFGGLLETAGEAQCTLAEGLPTCVFAKATTDCSQLDVPPPTCRGSLLVEFGPPALCGEDEQGQAACRFMEQALECAALDPPASGCEQDLLVTWTAPGTCAFGLEGPECSFERQVVDCGAQGGSCRMDDTGWVGCDLTCDPIGFWREQYGDGTYLEVIYDGEGLMGQGFGVDYTWGGPVMPYGEEQEPGFLYEWSDGQTDSGTYDCRYTDGCDAVTCLAGDVEATWTRIRELWCRYQWPETEEAAAGSSLTLYGRVHIPGVTTLTEMTDSFPLLVAEAGIGPRDSDPQAAPNDWSWTWAYPNEGYHPQSPGHEPSNDEYLTWIEAPPSGEYDLAYRFSLDGGEHWVYCDKNANEGDQVGHDGSEDGYQPANAGKLVTVPGGPCQPNPCNDPPPGVCQSATELWAAPNPGVCSEEQGEPSCEYQEELVDCWAQGGYCSYVNDIGRCASCPDLGAEQPEELQWPGTIMGPGSTYGSICLANNQDDYYRLEIPPGTVADVAVVTPPTSDQQLSLLFYATADFLTGWHTNAGGPGMPSASIVNANEVTLEIWIRVNNLSFTADTAYRLDTQFHPIAAYWSFDGSTADITLGEGTAGQAPGMPAAEYFTGYPPSGKAYSAKTFPKTERNPDKYIQFQANLSDFFNLSLSFDERRSLTGIRTFELWYAADGQNFVLLPGSVTQVPDDDKVRSHSYPLPPELATATATLRIYGYAAESDTTATWRLDNVAFRGFRPMVMQ